MFFSRGSNVKGAWLVDKICLLTNCNVFDANSKCCKLRNITLKDGLIIPEVQIDHADVIMDCTGMYLAPGYIDWQVNGAFGVDFSNDDMGISLTDGAIAVANQIVDYGVTSFCPTIVTCPIDVYSRNIPKFRTMPGGPSGGANILPLHLEGPMLSEAKAGAHRKQYLQAPSAVLGDVYGLDAAYFADNRTIGVVTMAAELEGACDAARSLRANGIAVSLGHSDCSVEIAEDFIAAGASAVTHLFNAQSFLSNRNPGVVGLLGSESANCDDNFDDETVPNRNGIIAIGIIADGVHVHKNALKMAHRCAGRKVSLVTDSIALAGLPDGDHFVASQHISMREGRAVVASSGVLVGSVAFMDHCVRTLHGAIGVSIGEAAACGSEAASKLLGLFPKKGSLNEGSDADIIILDDNGYVLVTIVGGCVVFCSSKW